MEYDYYEDRPRIPEEEHRRRIRRQVQIRCHLRQTINPFEISTTEFHRLFRMTQAQLTDLVEILRPYMPAPRGFRSVSVETKVLCAIAFFAQGSYQRPHGRMVDLNLSQSAVSKVLHGVVSAFNHRDILRRFVHLPATQEERNVIINRNALQGMPGVLGYIDGTLVKITPPSGPDKHTYRSRKGYTAINVQIVCYSRLFIMNVNAQFPGSANDPWIYRVSPIRAYMREAFNESPCWLLGDSVYPHEPWLQLPLLHAAPGTPEYRYTKLHCRNRNCVERCIGVLKARWRCLLTDRTLHYSPVKAGLITNACVVLHNYLRMINAPDPEPVYENIEPGEPEEPYEEELPLLRRADEVRAHLIAHANQHYNDLHNGD